MPIYQPTQKEWQEAYEQGKFDVRFLWDFGFRPRSNKYKSALHEYKYYKRFYSITITLSTDDYDDFKMCEIDVMNEQDEAADREEYDRYLYLKNKYE